MPFYNCNVKVHRWILQLLEVLSTQVSNHYQIIGNPILMHLMISVRKSATVPKIGNQREFGSREIGNFEKQIREEDVKSENGK